MVHEPKRFFELLNSSEFEVCDARMVNDDMVEVQYRNTEEFAQSTWLLQLLLQPMRG